jgi:hypothetical protein
MCQILLADTRASWKGGGGVGIGASRIACRKLGDDLMHDESSSLEGSFSSWLDAFTLV